MSKSGAPPTVGFGSVYALLRSIRAEAQGLDKTLRAVEASASEKIAAVRTQSVTAAVEVSVSRLEFEEPNINNKFQGLFEQLASDPDAADRISDEVTLIENAWQQITEGGQWPKAVTSQTGQQADDALVAAAQARSLLREMIYHCGLVTIPSRLNQHLAQLRVGQTLSFGEMFQDELPEESDRLKLLKYLRQHPTAVHGVVDVAKGLVYRADPRKARRLFSYVGILMVVVLGGLLAYFLPTIAESMRIPGWTEGAEPTKFLLLYLTLLLGGVVHLGVDALKQIKQASTSSEPTFLAIEDWLTWLHVRELYIGASVVSLWIGFVGLVFVLKDTQVSTAFLMGYSIDSFVDLFMKRFTGAVEKGTAELTTRVEA